MKKLTSRLAIAACILAPTPLHAKGVNAGEQIENIAQAEYQSGGTTLTVTSNTVTLQVNELLDVALTSLQSGPQTVSGGTATIPFEISNTGNGPEAYYLTVGTTVPGNDFEVTVTSIAIDRNGNNLFDPSIDEILPASGLTGVFVTDGIGTILVNVTLPAGTTDGQTSQIELLATAATGSGAPGTAFAGAGELGVDAIVGATSAAATALGGLQVSALAVTLIKSVTIADPFGGTEPVPGAALTYTIRAEVTGSGAAEGLVVSDSFPAGTSYLPGTLSLDSASQSDAADGDAGSASTTGIQVNLGTVAAGTTREVSFNVRID